jgi:uncharacterized protein (DUF433 family)
MSVRFDVIESRMRDRAVPAQYSDGLDLHDVPGVIVDRRPPEVRARLLGTGLEVWEVAKTYYEVGEDWERLRRCYETLSDDQLRAALTFAEKYWDVIAARIAEEYAFVPESLRETVPSRWR